MHYVAGFARRLAKTYAMGLRAKGKAANDLCQQHIDAPAQVTRAKREPNRIDADHRPTSRSRAASSRVCASGQCNSTRVAPELSSTRIEADDVPAGTRAATKPLADLREAGG